MTTEAERAAFKRAELHRGHWCAECVGEAVAAERARIAEAVRGLDEGKVRDPVTGRLYGTNQVSRADWHAHWEPKPPTRPNPSEPEEGGWPESPFGLVLAALCWVVILVVAAVIVARL